MPNRNVAAHLAQLERLLEERQELTTRDIMSILSVSESTARRLIHRLATQDGITRTFGGVCRTPSPATEYRYEMLERQGQRGKREIAQRALTLIGGTDVLYLDGGTTNACLAQALSEACRDGRFPHLTVFTNSLVTLNLLSPVCPVYCTGGRYRPARRDFCGEQAESAFQGVRFSKCFLGADACELTRGFTTTDFETARLCAAVLERSAKSYVLADADKFGRTALLPYAPLAACTAIVTDSALASARKAAFAAAGARFLPASPGKGRP